MFEELTEVTRYVLSEIFPEKEEYTMDKVKSKTAISFLPGIETDLLILPVIR